MKLNVGRVAFPIEFDNGAVESICFNPTDPDLMLRLADFQTILQEKAKELDSFELDVNGEPKSPNAVNSFANFKKFFCDELDRAFGGDVSKNLFKYCGPFAVINGEFFVTQFLDGIRPEIERKIEEANKALAARMAEHTDKYKK